MDLLDCTLEEYAERNQPRRQHSGQRRQRNNHDEYPDDRRKRARRGGRFHNNHDDRYRRNNNYREDYRNPNSRSNSNYQRSTQRHNYRTSHYQGDSGGGGRGRGGGGYDNRSNNRFNNRDNRNNSRYQRQDYDPNWRGHQSQSNYSNGRGPRNQWRNDRNQMNRNHSNFSNPFPNRSRLRPQDKLPRPDRPGKEYYIPSTPKSNGVTDVSSDAKHYGYVTLVMKGDNYIPGALILAHSLKVVASAHSLIVMITEDVSPKARDALSLLYDYVVNVPYIEYKGLTKEMKTDKQKEKYKEWASGSFTKWNLLNLNQFMKSDKLDKSEDITFEKLLFLDSDKIVISNIDHLFTDETLQCPAGTFSSPWTNKHSTSGLIDYYPKSIQHGEVVPADSIYDALYNNGFVAVGTGMLFRPNEKQYHKFIEMLDRKWISDEYLDNNIDKEKIRMRRIKGKFKVKTNEDTNSEKVPSAKSVDSNVKSSESAESENELNGMESVDTQNEMKSDFKSDFPDAAESKSKPETKVNPDDVEKSEKSLSPISKMALEEKNSDRTIGFRNCYSMLDEQSIVYFYFYHKIPWHYLDVKYNFIPWHFKWLQRDDGSLDIPSVLHFFGTKPWVQSPVEWRDLQAWWGLVFHLLNFAAISKDSYSWNEGQKKLVESFFDLDLMNKLPLEIFVEEQADFVNPEDEMEKRVTSGVRCFWCYELAKRKGLDPDGAIKRNSYKEIEWIFHCPIDPSTGKLCCPKLLNKKNENGLNKENVYDLNEAAKVVAPDDADNGREPTRAMEHEVDEEEVDELAANMNDM